MAERPKTFALLGHPVGHSVSPAIHQAVYEQFGLEHRYVAIDCPDRNAVSTQASALRGGELAGANITVPHKRLAVELADVVDSSARETGAANVWVRDADGRIVAHNTDVRALVRCVEAGRRRALGDGSGCAWAATVLGSGGAALAAVVACRQAGAGAVFVGARKWVGDRTEWPSAVEFEALGAHPVAFAGGTNDAARRRTEPSGRADGERGPATAVEPSQIHTLAEAAASSRVIVQASSAGMRGVGQGEQVVQALPWDRLERDVFLYDLVYNPPRTPFLEAAERHGLVAEGGLSMLVGQAALSVELWLGLEPDHERMRRAAQAALFGGVP